MKIKDETVFQLEGRPRFWVALPLGMQHILAMFVSNVAPILIITGIVGLEPALTRIMVQAAMFTVTDFFRCPSLDCKTCRGWLTYCAVR